MQAGTPKKKNGGVETVRIQFTLPASLVREIDEYCEGAHMLRSTYVEYTLASSLFQQRSLTSGVTSGLVGSFSDAVGGAGE